MTPRTRLVALAVIPALAATYVFFSAVLCGLLAEESWCRWWPYLSLESIQKTILAAGIWGAGVSIGLMIAHSFVPFPAEFVAIANGMVYGPFWGTVVTWVGAMLGASLAFGISRRLGRRFVHRKLAEVDLEWIEDWVDRHGNGALLGSRIIPVISFNLINYAAGLLNVSWWAFFWTTGIGILPLTILMVVMGDNIHLFTWEAWLLFVAAAFFFWLAVDRFSRRLRSKGPSH